MVTNYCASMLREELRMKNEQPDVEKLSVLQRDAAAGTARAQRLLALRYARGRGIERDQAAALLWMRRAAEQGLALAQRDLALWYWDGTGVEVNRDIALPLMRAAAAQGDPIALAKLRHWGAGHTA